VVCLLLTKNKPTSSCAKKTTPELPKNLDFSEKMTYPAPKKEKNHAFEQKVRRPQELPTGKGHRQAPW